MPYYDDFKDEDELNNPEGPQLAGASQLVGGSQNSQAPGAPNAKGPSRSERFQNLNSYLDANAGNQFGETFAGKVGEDVAKGAQAQAESGNQFQQLANSGAVAKNTSLVDSAVTDPTKFVQDANNVSQFKAQKDAQYKGPNSYADAGDLYQKASGATTKGLDVAEKAQTEGGRFALLDNYFGRSDYNQGQKSLDNLLVSGNDNATQGLAQARKNAQDQMQSFQTQNKQLSDYAATKRGETEATQKYAREALGIDSAGKLNPYVAPPAASGVNIYGAGTSPLKNPLAGVKLGEPTATQDKKNVLSDLFGSLDTKAKTAASKYEQQRRSIENAIESGDFRGLSAEERQMLGLDGKNGAINTFGVDPSKYISVSGAPSDYTASSVATRDQAAKLKALAQLADIDPTTLIDESKAGSAPKSFAQLDLAGLTGAAKKEAQFAFDKLVKNGGTGLPVDIKTQMPSTSKWLAFNKVSSDHVPTDLLGQIKFFEEINQKASAVLDGKGGVSAQIGQDSDKLKAQRATQIEARNILGKLYSKLDAQKAAFEKQVAQANFRY